MSSQAPSSSMIPLKVGTCNVLYESYYKKYCQTQKMTLQDRHKAWKVFLQKTTSSSSYDILCLQELAARERDWEDPLKAAGFTGIEYSRGHQGQDSTAVAWKSAKFSQLAVDVFSFPNNSIKSAVKVVLQEKTSGKLVTAVSAHLPRFPSEDAVSHRDKLVQLHDFVMGPIPGASYNIQRDTTVVVCGDFNVRPYQTTLELEKQQNPQANLNALQSQLEAQGETLPVFSSTAGWVDLTLQFDWSHCGNTSGKGPSRVDYILTQMPNAQQQQKRGGDRYPAQITELVKHDANGHVPGPAFGDYFSDHAFIGVVVNATGPSATSTKTSPHAPGICKYHSRPGGCRRGATCPDIHQQQPPGTVVCRYWTQGHCRNGANCNDQHPGATPSPSGVPKLASSGKHQQTSQVPWVVCRYWNQGHCRNGANCTDLHQPDATTTQQPPPNAQVPKAQVPVTTSPSSHGGGPAANYWSLDLGPRSDAALRSWIQGPQLKVHQAATAGAGGAAPIALTLKQEFHVTILHSINNLSGANPTAVQQLQTTGALPAQLHSRRLLVRIDMVLRTTELAVAAVTILTPGVSAFLHKEFNVPCHHITLALAVGVPAFQAGLRLQQHFGNGNPPSQQDIVEVVNVQSGGNAIEQQLLSSAPGTPAQFPYMWSRLTPH